MSHHKFQRGRRSVLGLLATACAIAPIGAWSQDVAGRTIKLIVGNTPGSLTDLVARMLSPSVSELTKSTWVVDNRPGAGGSIGNKSVASAAGDGTTLLLGDSSSLTVSSGRSPN